MTIEKFFSKYENREIRLKDIFGNRVSHRDQFFLLSLSNRIDSDIQYALQGSHQESGNMLLTAVKKTWLLNLMKLQNEILEMISGFGKPSLN